MTKWVCFDEAGAGLIRADGRDTALRRGDALMAAMRAPGNSVSLMPSPIDQEIALLSVVKRERVVAPLIEMARPASRGQATGFLGLTDEPEFADETEQKPWWKRW